MRFSTVLSTCLLLTGVLAIYPPPDSIKNIDSSDSSLVTIQNDLGDFQSKNGDSIAQGYAVKEGKSSSLKGDDEKNDDSLSGIYSLYLSISMIIVSEIGDKTFLIAAIMSMRHPRMVVLSAAASALVLMTILSGLIGHVLPTLLSPKLTRTAAAILFFVFGINLFREGLSVDKNAGVEEELQEVEEEIAAVELNELSNDLEANEKKNEESDFKSKLKNIVSYISSPVWFQTFSMTFLGEWGDRSQITTIAMAAGSDWFMVILGGSLGHFLCTALAVVAGQFVSTKISLRTILFGGSIAFFIFSGLYGYSALYE